MAEVATTADWIAAWGQVGGAVGTTAAVGIAIWLALRESCWRKTEQADRDAAQARLLTIDTDYHSGGHSPFQIVVIIANNSSAPMLDVGIEAVRNLQEPGLGWGYGADDPEATVRANVLVPGQRLVVEVVFIDEDKQQQWPGGPNSVTVTYTDSSGLRWRRQDRQLPERILAKPSAS
jgi:hypothetical protein